MTIECPCCGMMFIFETESSPEPLYRVQDINTACSDGNIPPDGYEFGEVKGGEEDGGKCNN
ncbi:MAG: hypothetical protein ACI4WS_13825 [Oscillospiraceae bacterium]